MTYIIGIDYGSDSCRAILVNAESGEEIATSVFEYPRWKRGLFCSVAHHQFRQHPLDYIEGLESSLKEVISKCPEPQSIKAINIDTTCSTPCFVDEQARPLALHEEFAENPNAMFILWKDHSAHKEAQWINERFKDFSTDYSVQCGYDYSPECFWAKVAHVLRVDDKVREKAVGVIEACDYIVSLLIGNNDYRNIKASHCSASAKQLWSNSLWKGFPPDEFFEGLAPEILRIKHNLPVDYGCSDSVAGTVCDEWASKLGVSTSCVVGYACIDAHASVVGVGIRENMLAITLGTSAGVFCIMPKGFGPVHGVFGQAEGLVLPGYMGIEAGMSAFGDAYAWFKRLMMWPAQAFGIEIPEGKIIAELSSQAEALPLNPDAPFATDHFNGRRSPAPDGNLSAGFAGLKLTTSAPEMFKAIVESTVFGMKAIVDNFLQQGIVFSEIRTMGGIAQKSPYIMQMLADVLECPVSVSACSNCAAYGSALFACVNAGVYPNIEAAIEVIAPATLKVYEPDQGKRDYYRNRYLKYLSLADFCSSLTR